jgi:hypothetical protein
MSALSEAIDRAQKRLDQMTQKDRERFYALVLREELQAEGDAPDLPSQGDK